MKIIYITHIKLLPAIHLDLAPISHSTSDLGQCATALCSSASKLALVPFRRSKWAALNQIDFFDGKTLRA